MELTDAAVGICPQRGCRHRLVRLVFVQESETCWLDVATDIHPPPPMLRWPDEVPTVVPVTCGAHAPPASWTVTRQELQACLARWLRGRLTQRIAVRPPR